MKNFDKTIQNEIRCKNNNYFILRDSYNDVQLSKIFD